mmetsp:Transcript_87025/g.280888  ORF Transcript_87025/g.280888 Transcript_87025/m.280888 type:complete len:278 (+) Transcript_87025:1370-2203(+)
MSPGHLPQPVYRAVSFLKLLLDLGLRCGNWLLDARRHARGHTHGQQGHGEQLWIQDHCNHPCLHLQRPRRRIWRPIPAGEAAPVGIGNRVGVVGSPVPGYGSSIPGMVGDLYIGSDTGWVLHQHDSDHRTVARRGQLGHRPHAALGRCAVKGQILVVIDGFLHGVAVVVVLDSGDCALANSPTAIPDRAPVPSEMGGIDTLHAYPPRRQPRRLLDPPHCARVVPTNVIEIAWGLHDTEWKGSVDVSILGCSGMQVPRGLRGRARVRLRTKRRSTTLP